jgi:hypothetical protein
MTQNFYPQTLPPKTAKLWEELKIKKPDFLSEFYLSGGTALSLQLGHRESEDLDFFTQTDFETLTIQEELERVSKISSLETFKNTFDDAEMEPMPRMHQQIEWEQVRKRMGEVVRGVRL